MIETWVQLSLLSKGTQRQKITPVDTYRHCLIGKLTIISYVNVDAWLSQLYDSLEHSALLFKILF